MMGQAGGSMLGGPGIGAGTAGNISGLGMAGGIQGAGQTFQGMQAMMGAGGMAGGAGGMAGAGGQNPWWLDLGMAGLDIFASERQRQDMMDLQEEMMERADPFQETREGYLDELQALAQDPSRVEDRPGFEYRLELGREGVTRGLGAAGQHLSGRHMHALQEHDQAFAAEELERETERLMAGAQMGQQGAQQAAQIGTETGMASQQIRQQQMETVGRGLERMFGSQGQGGIRGW